VSQAPRLARARKLTTSVWSARADGYANPGLARLGKLAAARSSGMLPFSGQSDGAIFLRDGKVVRAESSRTPSLARPAELDPARPLSGLSAGLAAAEPIIDAALDLLSGGCRPARFRSAAAAGPGTLQIPVDELLAEVGRRQRLLGQLAAVITADTSVVRSPQLAAPQVRVSSWQWALLIRVRDGSTPRALAWELGRGVFATTTEAYRLLSLRLLSAAGHAPAAPPQPGGRRPIMSFTRAVSDKEGDDMPDDSSARPAAGSGG